MKTPLLVKFFIDGQNFHNRLKDFNVTIEKVNYPVFFDHILEKIRTHRKNHTTEESSDSPLPIQFLKAEWYAVQDTLINYYPYGTMKKIHLRKHVDNKNGNFWKHLIHYDTRHKKFPSRYKEIFNCEKRIDELVAEKAIESIKQTKGRLLKIEKEYKGKGVIHDGTQLDLIKIKFSGFLKIKYETRTWEEKGLDTAVACQMIASCLNTSNDQLHEDVDDVVPDYNSDIIVLISSDMDFMEAFKILHALKVPCYMVHITNKLPKDLNGIHPCCAHLEISENDVKKYLI